MICRLDLNAIWLCAGAQCEGHRNLAPIAVFNTFDEVFPVGDQLANYLCRYHQSHDFPLPLIHFNLTS
jgi:hypothetical protein